MCIFVKSYTLGQRIYSTFAQIFLHSKQTILALDFYQKLLNCSNTAKDLIGMMYAYFMLGQVNKMNENYQEAILCYKYALSLAWTVDSVEAEMACYRELCAARYHLGHVEKSKFYDDRVLSGHSEPQDSQSRQTAVQ